MEILDGQVIIESENGVTAIALNDIFFYVNLALFIVSLVVVFSLLILCKKTAYRIQFGLVATFVSVFAFASYIVQLILYAKTGKSDAQGVTFAIYFCFALYCLSFIMASVYCFLLCKRSDTAMCIVTGVLLFIAPIGAGFLARLAYVLKQDSPAQKMVFGGYMYTFAAVKGFTEYYTPVYIDTTNDFVYKPLSEKEAYKFVIKLKKQAKTADTLYAYAAARAHYFPLDTRIAVRALKKAAKKGSAPAAYNIGYLYEIGYYFRRSYRKATKYYNLASALGDSDSKIRQAVVAMARGKKAEAAETFRSEGEKGNPYGAYNFALCLERGAGVEKNVERAIDIYLDCANQGLFEAQQRLFSLVGMSVGITAYDDVFRKIASYQKLSGEFALIMEGAIAIKEKRAANAADAFKAAIKYKGKWEGDARLFVGTLYVDRGKKEKDRIHGAEFIKSSLYMTPLASDIYAALPAEYKGKRRKKSETNIDDLVDELMQEVTDKTDAEKLSENKMRNEVTGKDL